MKDLRVAFSFALCFCICGCSEQSIDEPVAESPAVDTTAEEQTIESPVVGTATEEPIIESPVADTATEEPIIESPVADTATQIQDEEISRGQPDAGGRQSAETQDTDSPFVMAQRAALGAIRTIMAAEFSFFEANRRFASLAEMSEEYIDKTLASGEKGGYKFTIDSSESGFEVVGTPIEQGVTGVNAYFADQSGIIRSTSDGTAPDAESPTNMDPF